MTEHEPIIQWEPVFGDADVDAVSACVRSGWLNEAGRTAELEARLAELLGVRHVAMTPSGTVAIALALMSAGVGPGMEVIVPDFTFFGTISAVRLCGARPVLADVRASDFTLDPANAATLIGPRTRAILPVHLNGRAADVTAFENLAARHGLALIFDACQALGSRSSAQPDALPLGQEGLCSCFSLATTKIITTGQGGFISTNDDGIRRRLTELKDQGRLSRSHNFHASLGFNFKFTDLQAALGLSQLAELPQRLEKMQATERSYRARLATVPEVVMPAWAPGESPWFIDILASDAGALVQYLASQRIQARPFYPPLHAQAPCAATGPFPNTDRASAMGVWLPCSLTMTETQIGRVCDSIESFFAARRAQREAC